MGPRKVIWPSWQQLSVGPNFVSPLRGDGLHLACSQSQVGPPIGGFLAPKNDGSGPKCILHILLGCRISGSIYMLHPRPESRSRQVFVRWSEGLAVEEWKSVAYFKTPWVSKFTFSLLRLEEVFLHSVGGSKSRELCINSGFYGSRSQERATGTHRDQDADSEAHREAHKRVLV